MAAKKYGRERAAQQAEVAKARADAEEAAEEARAEAEACEARTKELLARHTAICTEFDRKRRKLQYGYELVRAQWAEDRSSCVQQHAAKISSRSPDEASLTPSAIRRGLEYALEHVGRSGGTTRGGGARSSRVEVCSAPITVPTAPLSYKCSL